MLPHIDVCVATYRRPELLKSLLGSLFSQETGGRFTYSIHIADNDETGSAREVVQEAQTGAIVVTYDLEPEQNISLARNRSIAAGSGDFIATIDDDCCADRKWLLTLFDAITSHAADVVHGTRIPQFEPDAPEYLKPFFFPPEPETGSTSGYGRTTSNSFFRRALVAGNSQAFDPRLGRTGGEDTAFFQTLSDRGCRMIWCREAAVFAPVARHRATLNWILRRSFRYGNAEGQPPAFQYVRWQCKHAAALAVIGTVQLIRGAIDGPSRTKGLNRLTMSARSLASAAGRLARAAGYRYEEYGAKGRAKLTKAR